MAKKQLAAVPMEDLLKEIQKRQKQLPSLQKRRARLAADLDLLDRVIAALTASGRPRRGRPRGSGAAKVRRTQRAKNKMSLADALVGVMKGNRIPITAPAAAEAVKKAGYKSKAAKFRKIVALTLAKDKKRFKRVSRGKYALA